MATIRNFTPHTLHFLPPEGEAFEIPSEGIARVSMEARSVPVEGLGVPAIVQVPGEVVGLPAPAEGVVVVVSAMVANAARRPDVAHPAEFIREDGRIVGAAALAFPGLA
jgi:hypothetical protein